VKKGNIKLDSPFNLDYVFSSGQIFRWNKFGEFWYGIAYGSLIVLKNERNFIEYKIQGNLSEEDLKSFLGLDQDYYKILSIINKDPLVSKITHEYKGLRILKQNKRECFLSYLSASFNNIKRINKMLENLSYISKRKLRIGDLTVYDYPNFPEIRKIGEEYLRELGFGFRAKYIYEVANRFESDEELEELNNMSNEELEKFLLKLYGIGLKTSNCIMLYSYCRYESFPIDIWIERAIKMFYGDILQDLIKNVYKNYNMIKYIFNKLFNNYAGYAQIFLYVYIRDKFKKL